MARRDSVAALLAGSAHLEPPASVRPPNVRILAMPDPGAPVPLCVAGNCLLACEFYSCYSFFGVMSPEYGLLIALHWWISYLMPLVGIGLAVCLRLGLFFQRVSVDGWTHRNTASFAFALGNSAHTADSVMYPMVVYR
jgi:hypothetical protein